MVDENGAKGNVKFMESARAVYLEKGKGTTLPPLYKGGNVVGKAKEKAVSSDAAEAVCIDDENYLSKSCIAQRLRRKRERSQGQILPLPCQSKFFPSLTPNRKVLAQRRRNESTISGSNHLLETPSQIEIRRAQITPLTDITNQILLPQCNPQDVNSILLLRNLGVDFLSTVDVAMPTRSHVPHNTLTIVQGRHSLGKIDIPCPFCAALHWKDEKLSKSSLRNPKFGTCCLQGKIVLPLLTPPPPAIRKLYDENDTNSISFRTHIRDYNNTIAFTSLGSTMGQRTFIGMGPIPFTIHGELRHRTGSLLPEPSNVASYTQLYIYDPDSALDIRDERNPRCKREVLKIIQDVLLEYNDFSKIYRQAYEILKDANSVNQNIPAYLHYSSVKDRRRYNLPSADEIAIILPGDGTEISAIRDIVIHLRGNNGLVRISECHPAYLPLHYVLLFPCGELGWEPNLTQWDVANNRPSVDRISQMQWYSYRLFQRHTEYSTILRGQKLFQEFLADAWAATEQNRLNYCRLNQGKLRAELYRGLTDIEETGLHPNQVGQRFILPSSHPGSP